MTDGYLAVFVCMATRAVHLEIVSDISRATFLAAFRQMVSRRGHCREVLSDNGRNSVSPNSILQGMQQALQQSSTDRYTLDNRVKWLFTIPAAPHMGGIYEAAVKIAKKHIVRVVGEQWLTF